MLDATCFDSATQTSPEWQLQENCKVANGLDNGLEQYEFIASERRLRRLENRLEQSHANIQKYKENEGRLKKSLQERDMQVEVLQRKFDEAVKWLVKQGETIEKLEADVKQAQRRNACLVSKNVQLKQTMAQNPEAARNITKESVEDEINVELQLRQNDEADPKSLDFFSRFEHELLCPISHDMLKHLVAAADGHTYELEFMQEWLSRGALSPMTGQPLGDRCLVVNHTIRKMIGLQRNYSS